MKIPARLWLLPALHVCAVAADDSRLHTLTVAPQAASVVVGPQPSERHFFELPSLDYVFRIEARCHSDWKPESLLLNVADSRVTRAGAELQDNAIQQLELEIPAKQLAPIAMRDFCVIDPAAQGSVAEAEMRDWNRNAPPRPHHMTIGAALSVHASLRCSLGDEQRTVYVSEPLDVTLACALPEPVGGPAVR
jgi:hypothetical protein